MKGAIERAEEKGKKERERLARFSVTMPESLVREFDQRLEEEGEGAANRSKALRGLMRRYVTEKRWGGDECEVYGTITLVYDHHIPHLARGLTQAQHDHGGIIFCSTHVHIDHNTCLECIIVRGPSLEIRNFFKALEKIRELKSLDITIAGA